MPNAQDSDTEYDSALYGIPQEIEHMSNISTREDSMKGIADAFRNAVDCDVEEVPEPLHDVAPARKDTLGDVGLMTYREPKKILTQEKAWMRTAAYLMAKGGMTQNEIAAAVGKTPSTISILMTQPNFRKTVTKIISDMGIIDDSHLNILRAAGSAAAAVLVELIGNAKSETVKLQAANSLLDRVLGRPVQTIQTSKATVPLDPSDELRQLKHDVARYQSELSNGRS